MLKLFALALISLCARVLSESAFSPARPPAIPLAVRGPYTSAWSSTADGAKLNTREVIFWNGNPIGWEAVVHVDGRSYRIIGNKTANSKPATQKSLQYDSGNSVFTFWARNVEITATFLSPITPNDLCRTSIPLSYLKFDVRSLDGNEHKVGIFNAVGSNWINGGDGSVTANLRSSLSEFQSDAPVSSWFVSRSDSLLFSENNDQPLWGNLTFSTSKCDATSLSYTTGSLSLDSMNFQISNHAGASRGKFDHQNGLFGFYHDMGQVSDETKSVLYTVGTMQDSAIQYTDRHNETIQLQPWWNRCYGDVFSAIHSHFNDYAYSSEQSHLWDQQLRQDIEDYYSERNSPPLTSDYTFDPDSGYGYLSKETFLGVASPESEESQEYYSLVALSVRQLMGAYTITESPASSQNSSQPLVFQKEISSDGNVNTVDVMFPAMPFFLYANPELLRLNMEPLFEYQEAGLYPQKYSIHDLGARYPNATGHPDGRDEYMPVEESGNMLIMALAYYRFAEDAKSWLQSHYEILKQWNEHLIDFSLTPDNQLSTDDFAGPLINQTNLAIKGIVGIAAMKEIASVCNQQADADRFDAISKVYMDKWQKLAIDPSGKHTLLSYQWRSSWGILYNIYPDKLLNLNIVPEEVYTMQSDWYPTVSQEYGIPLDSRHSYTKSDWELWAAAVASDSTRRLIVTSVGSFISNTVTDRPLTDLYDTANRGEYPVSPNTVYFIARPVVGGHFALLALDKVSN